MQQQVKEIPIFRLWRIDDDTDPTRIILNLNAEYEISGNEPLNSVDSRVWAVII
jgi:hypothetical protein